MSLFLCALQNLHDMSFDAAPLLPIDPHHNPVSVHHPPHLSTIEIKILRTLIVENEEAVTVRVRVDSPETRF